MWTGSISFGLVNIPVKVFTAVRHKEVHFHMLHDADGGRIRQKRVCEVDGKEVAYEHIAKGFEISAGNYVMIDPKELEKLSPKATRSIDIEDFVDLKDVDPIFYESNYYLAPDRGAAKPYGLLLEAMRRTGKVGIARMVMRTKQYLCAIRPKGEALVMHTLLYGDEIVDVDEIEDIDKHTKPGERELAMAEQLVGSLSGKWKPEKYKDEYREQVEDLIKKKAEGQEIVVPEVEEAPAKVVNLMDALRKSLANANKGGSTVKPDEQAEEAASAVAAASGEIRHRAQAARTARASKGGAKAKKASGSKSKKSSTAAKSKSAGKAKSSAKKKSA
jgi:DNA end-binding protein Ku